ncbi:MAG: TolB-like 6-bladed beta-propeller domain-containing protein [Ignavibacteriaceae bacterium]|nr:TolB-like 6-bladed beta-propeller domain-containing protein [Ignavibacteriaceae bacterium]
MKPYYFFGILIFVIGCTKATRLNENGVIIDTFPKEAFLEAIELKTPPILFKPSNMCIVDSFLVVTQSRRDTIFTIFKLPNCEYLLSFGNQGKGPNEFNLSMEFVTLGTVYGEYRSFAVGNLLTKIQYYKINDILNRVFKPYRIERLPPKLNRFRAITYISDSLIFGAPYRGDMHLFEYNARTKVLKSFRDYPEKFPLRDPEFMREPFACFMATKPDNSKFVVAYYYKGIIEIYDLKNDKQIIISYRGFPSLRENTGLNRTSKYLEFRPESLRFCERIFATNKYIYACIANEKYSTIYDADGLNRTFIREIHVFDWSGNPIIKYKLDKFYNYYVIDKIDNYLYTIDDSVENIIMRYDLRKLLN